MSEEEGYGGGYGEEDGYGGNNGYGEDDKINEKKEIKIESISPKIQLECKEDPKIEENIKKDEEWRDWNETYQKLLDESFICQSEPEKFNEKTKQLKQFSQG